MKDWTGNNKSVFVCNGASNHTAEEREPNDFYATHSSALELIMPAINEELNGEKVWECAAGNGSLSKVLENNGYEVVSTDLFDRDYGESGVDFLKETQMRDGSLHILTNPPYSISTEFVYKAMELLPEGGRLVMFLKLTFLESKKRRALFEKYPLKTLYVSSSRLQCAKNGDFEKYGKGVGTAVAYGWYVWQKGFAGDPVIKWFN